MFNHLILSRILCNSISRISRTLNDSSLKMCILKASLVLHNLKVMNSQFIKKMNNLANLVNLVNLVCRTTMMNRFMEEDIMAEDIMVEDIMIEEIMMEDVIMDSLEDYLVDIIMVLSISCSGCLDIEITIIMDNNSKLMDRI